MIVYIESNFVLELAFLQEEYESCDTIIKLAESQQIQLVIPAFSIAEPYTALDRRSKERKALHDRLESEIRELSRSKPYSEIRNDSEKLTGILIQSGEEEKQRLDTVLGRILGCAGIVPMGGEILRAAAEYQKPLGLSLPDSVIYASVVAHMSSALTKPKCFLNKNSKDFVNPCIQDRLASYDCRLITRFADGLGYIRHQLGRSG